uniref:C-type lectin domain-containing protein n=1 Tax=Panagrolaimus davidi TaxID=227884 RepID=A0A914QXG0_9BILA
MFYLNSSGFADAELNCNQNGGHLASIHDGFTNALLPQEAYKRFHESTETDFWIGATNLMSGNSWNWTDGSPFDFKDWKTGEPQNTTGANCAVQSLNDGFWSAQDCFKPKAYVCKTPLTYYTTTKTYPLTFNCSDGWNYFAPTHSCYGVNRSGYHANWTAAEVYCVNNGAHLPSIHSFAEFRYLMSYLYVPWYNVWTGIFSPDSGKTWMNKDETTVEFLKYANWCTGYPTNTTGERCVLLDNINERDCYSDFDCISRELNTVCKKPLFI